MSDDATGPPSVGPTAASPHTTATTHGAPPELALPSSFSIDEQEPKLLWAGAEDQEATLSWASGKNRSSFDLIVYKDECGKPSAVRDERPTNTEPSSDEDAMDESDAEEWLAAPSGGFVPSPSKRHGTWTPAAMHNRHLAATWHRHVGGSLGARGSYFPWKKPARKKHTLLMIAAIVLGPNLALFAYLCGAGVPSGSAATPPACPEPAPAPEQARASAAFFPTLAPLLSGLPLWQGGEPIREREPTGNGFWLLPAVLWKRGVVLLPPMVG